MALLRSGPATSPRRSDTEKLRTGLRRHSDLSRAGPPAAPRPPPGDVPRRGDRRAPQHLASAGTRPRPGRHHPAGLRQDQGDPVRPGPDDRRKFLHPRQARRRHPLRRHPAQGREPQGPRRVRAALRDDPRQPQPGRRRHQGRPGLARAQSRSCKASSVILVSFSLSALEARIAPPGRGLPPAGQLLDRLHGDDGVPRPDEPGQLRAGPARAIPDRHRSRRHPDPGQPHQHGPLRRRRRRRTGWRPSTRPARTWPSIDIPITWIYGEHDHWVKPEFVRDIMSVQSEAPRDVIAVPLGPQRPDLRRSAAALRNDHVARSTGSSTATRSRPVPPGRKDMEIMRRAEKDRIPSRKIQNRQDYWQRYLVGEDKLIGFDVMALSDDYAQLMEDQLRALDLRPDDRLLDLGGGTGNFVEHLLEAGRPSAGPDHDRRPHPRGHDPGPAEARRPSPRPAQRRPPRLPRPRCRAQPFSPRPPLPGRRDRPLPRSGRRDREPVPRERRDASTTSFAPRSTASSAASRSRPTLDRWLKEPVRSSRIPDHRRFQPGRPLRPGPASGRRPSASWSSPATWKGPPHLPVQGRDASTRS